MSKISSVFLPANEYLGVLWALSGVKDVAVINHGTGGCNFFEFATASDRTKRLIHDRFCSTGMEAEDIALSGGEDKLKAAMLTGGEQGVRMAHEAATGDAERLGFQAAAGAVSALTAPGGDEQAKSHEV